MSANTNHDHLKAVARRLAAESAARAERQAQSLEAQGQALWDQAGQIRANADGAALEVEDAIAASEAPCACDEPKKPTIKVVHDNPDPAALAPTVTVPAPQEAHS